MNKISTFFLLVINFLSLTLLGQALKDIPFSWDNASVYFVITDRFNNGDVTNDQSYNRGKDGNGAAYPFDQIGSFYGGDFKGLSAKIDEGYFDKLGTNAIWVTAPYEQIHGWVAGGGGGFQHYPYHGYYTLDWSEMDANMGTKADFQTFVDKAHNKGIRVLVDIVMNHTGYNTAQDMTEYNFGCLNTAWKGWRPGSGQTWNNIHDFIDYSTSCTAGWANWWGPNWVRSGLPGYPAPGGGDQTMSLAGLPDVITESVANVPMAPILNTKWSAAKKTQQNAEFDAFFNRTGYPRSPRNYIVKWLTDWVREFGIDGFRVDTQKHVEPAAWKALKDQSVIALRDWKAANPTKKLDNLDFWMVGENFGAGFGKFQSAVDGGFDGLINFGFQDAAGNPANYESLFSSYAATLNTDPNWNTLSYISSHDTKLFDRNNLINAGTSLMLLPGAIQIYYGDETKRLNGPSVSADVQQETRSYMNWNSIDQNVLSHYQKLGQFRRNHLSVGGGTHTKLKDAPYTFRRVLGNDKVVVVIGASGATTVDVSSVFTDGTQVRDFYTSTTGVVLAGNVTFTPDSKGIILIESTGVANPTVSINPASGNYLNGSSLQISITSTGVGTKTIYYTTNGTQPSTVSGASLVYTAPFSINSASTIKAMVVQADGKASAVATNTYTFNPAPPVVTVSPAGPHTAFLSVNVTISGVDDSGIAPTIYYTTNGSTPTTSSPSAVSVKTISVTSNMTIKTFAVDNQGLASAVQSHDFSITTVNGFTVYFKKPTNWGNTVNIHFWNSLPAGNLTATVWPGVATSTAPGVNWYKYTFTNITSTSLIFNSGANQTVDLTRNKTGWYSGTTWFDTNPENAAPVLASNPVAPFTSPSSYVVTISGTDDSGVVPTLYYTTNGANPTTASPSGVGRIVITITSSVTVKVIAVDNTNLSSPVASYQFNVVNNPPTVAVNPTPGTYSTPITVNLTGSDDSGIAPRLYVTTDGTNPTTALGFSTGSRSVPVSSTTVIKVLAVDNQGLASAVQTYTYNIVTASGFTVYFNKPAAWSTAIRIHYWNSLPAGNLTATAWPGVATTSDGGSWYKFTFTNITSTSLIFNDNGSTTNKTVDLTRNKTGWYSNGVWFDTDPRVVVTSSGITIHYFNSNNWATPYFYYWNQGFSSSATAAAPTAWPGSPMIAEGSGWFKFTIANFTCTSLIFSNNGASQTGNLARCGNGWYKNGVWSNTQPAREASDDLAINEASLDQNSPNPFGESTTVKFSVPTASIGDLSVQSTFGQKIVVFEGKSLEAGEHQLEFNRGNLSSGVYVFILKIGDKTLYKKFIIE